MERTKISGKVNLLDFERPEFKLGDVAAFFVRTSAKEVQNWTNRGYLKPVQRGIRKDRLYSLREVFKAVCMGHLSANPLSIASGIAAMVANRAECLVSEGFDFDPEHCKVYFYAVERDGSERGIYISKSDLSDVFLGKRNLNFVDEGLDLRIFDCDEMIFRVIDDYAKWRKMYPLTRFRGCDEKGYPNDPNHPCYINPKKEL